MDDASPQQPLCAPLLPAAPLINELPPASADSSTLAEIREAAPSDAQVLPARLEQPAEAGDLPVVPARREASSESSDEPFTSRRCRRSERLSASHRQMSSMRLRSDTSLRNSCVAQSIATLSSSVGSKSQHVMSTTKLAYNSRSWAKTALMIADLCRGGFFFCPWILLTVLSLLLVVGARLPYFTSLSQDMIDNLTVPMEVSTRACVVLPL